LPIKVKFICDINYIIISSQVLDMDEQMDIDSGIEPGLLTEVQLKALIQNVRECIIF
jgi:hypothetical protein